MGMEKIKTLGELKKSGYVYRSVKEEIRQNLIAKLKRKESTFPGIVGYDDTVIPDTERALLSRHNILFLGLRGQAKTRMARQMVDLLDEFIPIVAGSEVNDNHFAPLSRFARDLVASLGDQTPIEWLPREARYGEKLATPDVSVADLIGDVDPITAANEKLSYADERVIHFGIISTSCLTCRPASRWRFSIFCRKATSRSGASKYACRWISSLYSPLTRRTIRIAVPSSRH